MADFITNSKEFVKEALYELQRRIYPQEMIVAKRLFEGIKKELLFFIETHPVSQELITHRSPSEILNTTGSLFGFLGFHSGTRPIDTVLKITAEKTRYKVRKRLLGRGFVLDLILPELSDYRVDELVLPWEGGIGLVEAIERGFSGLDHYVKTTIHNARSRSGDGIQIQNQVRQRNFTGRPYLSEIFQRVRDYGLRSVQSLK